MNRSNPKRSIAWPLWLVTLACGLAACTTTTVKAPDAAPPGERPQTIAVPAGQFRMGDGAGRGQADELPVHDVAIRAFRLGRHEVTIGEFRRFVTATNYVTDAERNLDHEGCFGRRAPDGSNWDVGRGWIAGLSWQSPGYPVTDDHPVACVSFNDVQAYLAWMNHGSSRRYRLPSEAEWEYAARAGSTTTYPWGDDPDAGCTQANGRDLTPWPDGGAWDQHMNCRDGHFSPAPAGSYAANAFGLHEMIGNVSEWVQDCRHDSYAGAPADGSAWIEGGDCSARLVRGGTFVYGPPGLRSANRTWSEPSYRVWYQGFRVVEERPTTTASPITFGELPAGARAIGEIRDVRTEICRDLRLDASRITQPFRRDFRLLTVGNAAGGTVQVEASLCFVLAGAVTVDGVRMHGAAPLPTAFLWVRAEGPRDAQMRGKLQWVQLRSWYPPDVLDRTAILRSDPTAEFVPLKMDNRLPNHWSLSLELPTEHITATVIGSGQRVARKAPQPGFMSVAMTAAGQDAFQVFTYFGHHSQQATGEWRAEGSGALSAALALPGEPESSGTFMQDGWQARFGLYEFAQPAR